MEEVCLTKYLRPEHSENKKTVEKETFYFSFTKSGHQTENITVLDQHSVAFKYKRKPEIDRHMQNQY